MSIYNLLVMFFSYNNSEDNSVDPVYIPADLSVNTRVGWQCAGMNGPGHNSDLLAVNKQGAAVVILQLEIVKKWVSKTLIIVFTLHCPLPPSGTPAQMSVKCVFPE
jgi:hypothetical protein